MRLTALVESATHVCCRYRLAAFRPYLEAAGHTLELRPLPRRPWDWVQLGRRLAGSDAVIVQRKLLRPWQLYLVRRACRSLLFDFDDAVFLRDSYAPKGLQSGRRTHKFAVMVRAADAVVAGNDFLLAQAVAHGGASLGTIIPTCVDPRRYRLAGHHRAGEGVELVWIGSASTLQGLNAVRPLLERLGQHLPGLRLKLVCDRFLDLRHLPVTRCTWMEEGEAGALAAADIGISWLPDDDWSRGKCGLKVLQYMAAGLPVVANPVGVHQTLIRPGETGFLAGTEEQWVEAVATLARSVERRRRLGAAGRRVVEKEFRVEVGAQGWLALLDQLGRAARKAG